MISLGIPLVLAVLLWSHTRIRRLGRLLLLSLDLGHLFGRLVSGLNSRLQHDLLTVLTGLGSGLGLGGVQVSHQGGSCFFTDFPPDLAGLDNGALQLQLLLAEGIHMVHLRRAVDGQLADKLNALGVEVIDGRDPALLLVIDALALGVGQRIGISLLAGGGLGGQPVLSSRARLTACLSTPSIYFSHPSRMALPHATPRL